MVPSSCKEDAITFRRVLRDANCILFVRIHLKNKNICNLKKKPCRETSYNERSGLYPPERSGDRLDLTLLANLCGCLCVTQRRSTIHFWRSLPNLTKSLVWVQVFKIQVSFSERVNRLTNTGEVFFKDFRSWNYFLDFLFKCQKSEFDTPSSSQAFLRPPAGDIRAYLSRQEQKS